jgi:hypothetical protein
MNQNKIREVIDVSSEDEEVEMNSIKKPQQAIVVPLNTQKSVQLKSKVEPEDQLKLQGYSAE